jgi:hypothetical protein
MGSLSGTLLHKATVLEIMLCNCAGMPDASASAGPDGNALRLLLLAELVSAAGFERDRLYIEWQLHFDPEQWILQHSEQEVVQPGLIQVRLQCNHAGEGW